jgi:AmiR/NasT family two-component response regulator
VLLPKAIVLFVRVAEPVLVATVESIAIVAVVPDPLESIPVPPAIVNASEFKSTSKLPESVSTSKSSALI